MQEDKFSTFFILLQNWQISATFQMQLLPNIYSRLNEYSIQSQ